MGMIKNSERYLNGVGDAYYLRRKEVLKNLKKIWESDPIIVAMQSLGVTKGSYLEIGCADGWRLDVLRREFGMDCWGIEPSNEAAFGRQNIREGTADDLPFFEEFDVVSFAYMLYAVDRSDLFKIAFEGDRVLKDGGHMVVYDFYSNVPKLKENPDCKEMLTCKADYGGMFRWHPCYYEKYEKVQHEPDNPKSHPVIVNVFQKQLF